jgi:predicted phage terminase large subunit-like protein
LRRTDLQSELARRHFYDFVKQAWHVLEPAPFIDGIHVGAICQHLQAIAEGQISHLIINVPPGHAKSLLTAVFWPAWVWIDHPAARWLFSSYREDLAKRDSIRCRRLILSDWYQQLWGYRYQLSEDQNEKGRFENTATGYRVVVPMGTGTGERGDYVVVDDPHSVDGAESDLARTTALEWWNGSMATRLNDFKTGHKIVVQQRLHEADLSGDLLLKGGYELLCLPAEFEPERRLTTSIGWSDPRQEAGELLWPDKVSQANLEELKTTLGSYRYAGQYQQRPAPAAGGIFQRIWWRYWRPAHLHLPPVTVKTPDGQVVSIEAEPIPAEYDTVIQSWDLTFKDTETSDFAVGQVWAARKGDKYLLDQVRAKMDLPTVKREIEEVSRKWPKAATSLVEDKANGPAVIQELRHEIPGLIAVNPEGGKIARAHAASPAVESGNVYLPHPALALWVEAFIEEAAAFPCGRYDDQVDAMTQALNRLRTTSARYWVAESRFLVDPFPIPADWPCVFAMAVSAEEVAAVWGARDSGGTIYLFAEHALPHAEPSENARAIKAHGDWIPGVINFSGIAGSIANKAALTQAYDDTGLRVESAMAVEEAGVLQFWQLLTSNKLKVFRSLPMLLAAYRRGDDQSPLLLCCQSLVVSGRDRMRTKSPKLRLPIEPIYHGEHSWMA